MIKICPTCNQPFTPKLFVEKRQIYCSKKCKNRMSNRILRNRNRKHYQELNKKNFTKYYKNNKEKHKEKTYSYYLKDKNKWDSRSKTYILIYKTKKYGKLIDNKCKKCGSNINLIIHHEVYPKTTEEIINEIINEKIYFLCKNCHSKLRIVKPTITPKQYKFHNKS